MKKVVLLALLLALSWQVHAQNLENIDFTKRHELKLDAAYLIGGSLKMEYEYWLGEFSTVGAVGFYNFSSEEPDYRAQILATFRLFFSNNQRKGFFFEYNLGVTSGKHYEYGYPYESKHKSYAALGMGLAIGWKFHIPQNNVTLDLFGGVGRLFDEKENSTRPNFYPRVGVLLGKRFGGNPGTPRTDRVPRKNSNEIIAVPSL
jgi:hypothetical protein